MSLDRRHLLLGLGAGLLAGCAVRRGPVAPIRGDLPFTEVAFADWTDAEPEYLLYPGDEIEVAVPSAPELTRTIRVGPDGRVALPMIGDVMAADRTLDELSASVSAAYASSLVRPRAEVALRTAGPLRFWVDGEVRTPGVYEMPGDIDAYRAVVMAGGFQPTADQTQVALIRRGPGGARMIRVVDLRARRGEVIALRRGDLIFVPRTTLGELATFFTQVRNALPIGFNYTIGGQFQQF